MSSQNVDKYCLCFLNCGIILLSQNTEMETHKSHPLDSSLKHFYKYLVYLDKVQAGDDTTENVESLNEHLELAKEFYLLALKQTLNMSGDAADMCWSIDKVELERNTLKDPPIHGYPRLYNMLGEWLIQLLNFRKANLADLKRIQSLSFKDGFTGAELSAMVMSNFDDGADIRECVVTCVALRSLNNPLKGESYEQSLRTGEFYWQGILEEERFFDKY
jgi:hypothetical protein